eukprot:1750316-Prymnesium_polylepis.1
MIADMRVAPLFVPRITFSSVCIHLCAKSASRLIPMTLDSINNLGGLLKAKPKGDQNGLTNEQREMRRVYDQR